MIRECNCHFVIMVFQLITDPLLIYSTSNTVGRNSHRVYFSINAVTQSLLTIPVIHR